MRKDGRTWSKTEPSRQKPYRYLYLRYKNEVDRLDSSIVFLLDKLRKLEERVQKLERTLML
jgi:hypothetical protein